MSELTDSQKIKARCFVECLREKNPTVYKVLTTYDDITLEEFIEYITYLHEYDKQQYVVDKTWYESGNSNESSQGIDHIKKVANRIRDLQKV